VTTVGRPRDAAIDEAILSAAWDELERVGYMALTMTAVAEGAGIQKPALYRRWGTKPLLVIATVAQHLPGLEVVDHGSLRADLQAILHQLARAWSSPAARSLPPLLADLAGDDAAREAFHLEVLQPRGSVMRAALSAAVDRGEIAADAPLRVVADVLEGPLMHRALFGNGQLDDELTDSILTSCLALLTAP